VLARQARGEQITLPTKLRFRDAAEQWFEVARHELRPGVAREYRRVLDNVIDDLWGDRWLASLTPADCVELGRKLKGRLNSPASVGSYLRVPRAVSSYGVLKGWLGASPFDGVPRGALPSAATRRAHREWDATDIQKLIDAGYLLDERDEARTDVYGLGIETLCLSGARIGELLAATYADFDFASNIWTIRTSLARDGSIGPVKTAASERRVPMDPEVMKKIAARKLRLGAADSDHVFASTKGARPMSAANFRKRGWNKAVKNAGLSGDARVTPHDSRHAYASALASTGLSSGDVARALGHEKASTAEATYVHCFDRPATEHRIRAALKTAMEGAS
jgi:integrase